MSAVEIGCRGGERASSVDTCLRCVANEGSLPNLSVRKRIGSSRPIRLVCVLPVSVHLEVGPAVSQGRRADRPGGHLLTGASASPKHVRDVLEFREEPIVRHPQQQRELRLDPVEMHAPDLVREPVFPRLRTHELEEDPLHVLQGRAGLRMPGARGLASQGHQGTELGDLLLQVVGRGPEAGVPLRETRGTAMPLLLRQAFHSELEHEDIGIVAIFVAGGDHQGSTMTKLIR